MTCKNEQIILTRYLYNKTEVKHSLFLSILEHNMDEALFWGYELYYSGFECDVFMFLIKIIETIFLNSCSFMTDYANFIIKLWNEDNNPLMFGNLIATLCTKQYNLKDFCKLYLKIEGFQQNEREKNLLIVELDEDHIKKYKNIDSEQPDKVLKERCNYHIRKNVNRLFNLQLPEYQELHKIYCSEWLYYASHSPIWKERIYEYNGNIDNETKNIIFCNIDDEEAFYNKYNYNVDEQPTNIFHKIMGTSETLYDTIKDFCKKYKFIMKTKRRV